MRVGIGYDSHRLVEGRKLILGGVHVLSEKGLLGHSDGDALTHAIIDALLGAAGLGDIGGIFPDTDPRYKDANSLFLLKEAVSLLDEKGFQIVNVDSTIIAEAPRMAPHIPEMKKALSAVLKTPAVNIKAKSNERMGAIGRGEGIACWAVGLLRKS
jgi:2-C-methyl-D-erythritol 2,4-cyclodiphosphate synthase